MSTVNDQHSVSQPFWNHREQYLARLVLEAYSDADMSKASLTEKLPESYLGRLSTDAEYFLREVAQEYAKISTSQDSHPFVRDILALARKDVPLSNKQALGILSHLRARALRGGADRETQAEAKPISARPAQAPGTADIDAEILLALLKDGKVGKAINLLEQAVA